MTLLYLTLGVGAFAALVVMVGLVPVSACLARAVQAARKRHLHITDARLKATNEFLGAIKTSKLYGWERAGRDAVLRHREEELHWTLRENVYFGLGVTALVVGPVLGALAAFATHTLLGGELSSGLAFQAVGLITVLRFPLQQMAQALASAAHASVALQRIQDFLAKAGRAVRRPAYGAETPEAPTEGIRIRPVQYAWPDAGTGAIGATGATGATGVSLSDSSGTGGFSVGLEAGLQVRAGELCMVCGRVASGKSTLLSGLLGEATATALSPGGAAEGGLRAAGPCSFAAQTAFLLSATVRDNVVFGRPWDEGLYRRALWAACLAEDLLELRRGDATEVGEEGLVTSGGQRARIALARVLYDAPATCVADDVISALDAGTAARVARRALGPRSVLRDSARVLATHAVHLGAMADHIVVLDGGRVVFQGAWEDFEGSSVHQDLLEAEQQEGAPAEEGGPTVRGTAATGGSTAAEDAATGGPIAAEDVAAKVADAAATGSRATTASEVESRREAEADAAACALEPGDHSAPWWDMDLNRPPSGEDAAEPQESPVSAAAEAESPAKPPPLPKAASTAQLLSAAGPAGHGGRGRGSIPLMTEERRDRGRVSCAAFCLWLRAAGGWWWLAVIFLALAAERVAYVSVDFWLATWTTAADRASGRETTPLEVGSVIDLQLPPLTPETARSVYLAGYTVAVVTSSLLVLVRTALIPVLGWLAAGRMFRWLLWSVLRAPMSFFETTPRGRVISRLSFDVEILDFVLPSKAQPAAASVAWLLTGVGVLAGIVPWLSVAFVPIGLAWAWLQQRFSHAVRDLQRLDNATRSPIQTHFGETVTGAATIRAFRQTRRFEASARRLIDVNSAAVYSFVEATRWLGMRVDLLGSALLLATGLLCFAVRDTITGGLAGMAIQWSVNLTVSLNFCIVYITELEARLTSVERVAEYVLEIPREAELGGDDSRDAAEEVPEASCLDCACCFPRPPRQVLARASATAPPAPAAPPAGWPSRGSVSFEGVVMRYRPDLEPALKGLTMPVAGGERIGIVGKTGSGKSSTLAALFRTVPLDSGRITVDGVDIASLGLSDVRGAVGGMVIIPQEPSLFAGPIRDSLDPFGAFDDASVWRSLCDAGLGALLLHMSAPRAKAGDAIDASISVSGMLGQSKAAQSASAEQVRRVLAYAVDDGGSNFSEGTRQLVCLARALLRRPRVLVLDEATASVDPATDGLFQAVLREKFADTTCLIVAHRLDTIMDCDKVCVIAGGAAVELEHPAVLLERPESRFYQLVHARGSDEADRLRAMVLATE